MGCERSKRPSLKGVIKGIVICHYGLVTPKSSKFCGLDDLKFLDGEELLNVCSGRDYATKNACHLP